MRYVLNTDRKQYSGDDAELTVSSSDKINVVFVDEEQELSAMFTLSKDEALHMLTRLASILERS